MSRSAGHRHAMGVCTSRSGIVKNQVEIVVEKGEVSTVAYLVCIKSCPFVDMKSMVTGYMSSGRVTLAY